MVGRLLPRIAIFLLMFFVALNAFSGENQRVTIDIGTGLTSLDSNNWTLFGTGKAELDIRTRKTRNVKARLNIQMNLGEVLQTGTDQDSIEVDSEIFSVKYAYIKLRLPVGDKNKIRLLAGKNSLTWGVGSFYNAGNTVFGVEGAGTDLLTLNEDLREETDWYTSLFIPLGRFSFIEQVLLFPLPEIDSDSLSVTSFPAIEKTSLGTRLHTKIFNSQLEISYLYKGTNGEHIPAFSIQGNIGPDIYLSASSKIYSKGSIGDNFYENLIISGGLFWLNPFNTSKNLSIRLESLLRTDGSWKESHNTSPDGNIKNYGIEFFPEIIFNPTDRTTFIFRQIFSPIDFSTMYIFGLDWNIAQALHIYGILSFQLGETNDKYSSSSPGGFGIYSGLKYSF